MDKPPPLTWSITTAGLVEGELVRSFDADAQECAALAAYLGCLGVTSLKAHVDASPLSRGRFRLRGKVDAVLIRQSVVTLEDVQEVIGEAIEADFWPRDQIEALAGEREETLTFGEEDVPEPMEEGHIPVGRLVCEILAVSMDPYPRNLGESYVSDLPDGGRDNPFAVLERLKAPE
jgi:hypothetical protein